MITTRLTERLGIEQKWTPVVGQQVVEVKELFSVLLSP